MVCLGTNAANRTVGSNPVRFLCDIKDLVAVQGVSSEAVSAALPVKQGKHREFLRFSLGLAFDHAIARCFY